MFFQVIGDNGRESLLPSSELGRATGPVFETVADVEAYTLSNSHHGKILIFRNSSTLTVTVPAGLRSDFICGLLQGEGDTVTIAEGLGVAIEATGGNYSLSGQTAMATLMAHAQDEFFLVGSLA